MAEFTKIATKAILEKKVRGIVVARSSKPWVYLHRDDAPNFIDGIKRDLGIKPHKKPIKNKIGVSAPPSPDKANTELLVKRLFETLTAEAQSANLEKIKNLEAEKVRLLEANRRLLQESQEAKQEADQAKRFAASQQPKVAELEVKLTQVYGSLESTKSKLNELKKFAKQAKKALALV